MKVVVVGGGGREHAVIKKIKESDAVEKIYALPGNGGIAKDAECIDIGATDIEAIRDFAVKNEADLVIVTPDDPLVLGAVDLLREAGIKTFGPDKRAAIIEGSKAFSKNLMKKYGIPTAEYEIFSDYEEAEAYVSACKLPVVIKADGLALGKGVLICETREAASDALKEIMKEKKFGDSGNSVVIEEFLTGPEVSVLSFTDGNTVIPMVSSMDHKRALDGDKGLNTGGMGTIAPNPYYTEAIASECMEKIFIPTIEAMKSEGRPFSGCLYFGLMLTEEGPKVIEYNCRFGDPETQVVLPLLKSDLVDIMVKIGEGRLDEADVHFSGDSACCIVMASSGYPESYEKGFRIDMPCDKNIYVAGAKLADGQLITSGGRVLGVTETAPSLEEAVSRAYETVKNISFGNAYYRRDIGKKAIEAITGK